jgi:2-dehydro-3-deoxygluconokinase
MFSMTRTHPGELTMVLKDKIFDILNDDLSGLDGPGAAFVTFGEVMVRDTPADDERLERTRRVCVSLAGSELTLAMMLSRLGVPAAYITRVPDNPYGWMLRNVAREQGISTDHLVWADKTEPMGRLLYELGRTPRPGAGWYQRKYSAASKLGAGMVDWTAALCDARLFHTSGVSFGLSTHSGYERNYLFEAFQEAMQAKPAECWAGLDFNYRGTLWSPEQCRQVMTPIVTDYVDVLITTIEDMAKIYNMDCGRVSADEIYKGNLGQLEDDDLQDFMRQLMERFKLAVVGVTIRYPDTHEQHRWESAAMDREGRFFRSPRVQPIVLKDRLGGGDTWNGGFYYGLLTGAAEEAVHKGVQVGDAATRLKQTLMFDLPVVTKQEIQARMRADVLGGGKRIAR